MTVFVKCTPVPAKAYIINRYDLPVTITLSFANRSLFQYFKTNPLQGVPLDLQVLAPDLQSPAGTAVDFVWNDAALTAMVTVPAHRAIILSTAGPYVSRALRRDCPVNSPEDPEFLRHEYSGTDCDGLLLYALSSLSLDTPDGKIALTGNQMLMAFRRVDDLHFALDLNPDLPEFQVPVKRCCIF